MFFKKICLFSLLIITLLIAGCGTVTQSTSSGGNGGGLSINQIEDILNSSEDAIASGNIDSAIEGCTQVLASDPQNATANLFMGILSLSEIGRNPETSSFLQILGIDLSDPSAIQNGINLNSGVSVTNVAGPSEVVNGPLAMIDNIPASYSLLENVLIPTFKKAADFFKTAGDNNVSYRVDVTGAPFDQIHLDKYFCYTMATVFYALNSQLQFSIAYDFSMINSQNKEDLVALYANPAFGTLRSTHLNDAKTSLINMIYSFDNIANDIDQNIDSWDERALPPYWSKELIVNFITRYKSAVQQIKDVFVGGDMLSGTDWKGNEYCIDINKFFDGAIADIKAIKPLNNDGTLKDLDKIGENEIDWTYGGVFVGASKSDVISIYENNLAEAEIELISVTYGDGTPLVLNGKPYPWWPDSYYFDLGKSDGTIIVNVKTNIDKLHVFSYENIYRNGYYQPSQSENCDIGTDPNGLLQYVFNIENINDVTRFSSNVYMDAYRDMPNIFNPGGDFLGVYISTIAY